MVQKIVTGGTSSTRTPMLKFRMKEWLFDREARHMTHCANVESEKSKTHSAAIIPSFKIRSNFISPLLSPAKGVCRKKCCRHEMFIDKRHSRFPLFRIERNA